jgi:Ca2+/H+ antiporter, TMEM165/GDT1 family
LLEGLEVVFIVITFGLTAGDMRPALLGAAAAAVVVTGIGAAVHAPLSRVPENTLKFVVGVMLSGFGTFWAGEGVGLDWPGADLAILGLIVFYALTAGAIIALVRSRAPGSGKVVTQT